MSNNAMNDGERDMDNWGEELFAEGIIKPIKTEKLGILSGRDCIFLDRVILDDPCNLIFAGDINKDLIGNKQYESDNDYIKYRLIFRRVISYFMTELDTYENLTKPGLHPSGSSFNEVQNSKYLLNLPIRTDYNKDNYKHYQVFTYDNVFNILAESYEMEIER